MTLLAARTVQPLVKAQVGRQVRCCRCHQQQAQQHLIRSQVRHVPQLAVSVQGNVTCSTSDSGRTEALTKLPGISASVACCAAQLHRTLVFRNQMTEATKLRTANHMPTQEPRWCKLVYKHGPDESQCWRVPNKPTIGKICPRTFSWIWIRRVHGTYGWIIVGSASDDTRQCIWPAKNTS